MTDLNELTAVEQRVMLGRKEVSARELLNAHLDRIESVNGEVNAVVALNAEVATSKADAIDQMIFDGQTPGPLAGLVTAHKDLELTRDFPTTFGSPLFENNQPTTNSILVQRMADAGAVALGKTNVPEFGAGSHSFNPVYGTTLNAYDRSRSAGGSSGGAAAALASNMVAIADGSDMGGSLRNPAAWNNVVGFRNSPRVVPSADGDWSTLGMQGAMGRTVDDLVMLLKVIGQPHAADPLSRALELPDQILPPDRPLRVAISADLGGLPVEADVRAVLDTLYADIEDLGWQMQEAEPNMSRADECFRVLRSFAFATGPLSSAGDSIKLTKATIQDEVERGNLLSGQDVAKAQAQLLRLWKNSVQFFENYDIMLAPVTQLSPFDAELEYPTAVDGHESERYIDWMRSCCRVTTMGMPALSLPAGFTKAGLPVGVQIVGGPWQDLTVLRAAKAIESTTNHWQRRPVFPPTGTGTACI